MYNPQQAFGQTPPQGNLVNTPPPSGQFTVSEPTVILFEGKEYRAKHTGNSGPINPSAIGSRILKMEYRNGVYGPFMVFYIQFEDGFITRLQQLRNMRIPNNDVSLYLTSNGILSTEQIQLLVGRNCTIQVRYQQDKNKNYKTVPNSNPQGYYLTFSFVSGITPAVISPVSVSETQIIRPTAPTAQVFAQNIQKPNVNTFECPICHISVTNMDILIAHVKTH